MNLPYRTFLMTAVAAFCLASAPFAHADDKNVTIKATDAMKYDILAIDAEAGQTVNITLTNAGKMPKIAMAHNIVILKPGTDVMAFVNAAAKQAANNYLPIAEADSIVVSSKLLGPGESDTIQFTPQEAGTYDFVCTFPAHAMIGMHGKITVK